MHMTIFFTFLRFFLLYNQSAGKYMPVKYNIFCHKEQPLVFSQRRKRDLEQVSIFRKEMPYMSAQILPTVPIPRKLAGRVSLLSTPWRITSLISHGPVPLWSQSICPSTLRFGRFQMGIRGYVHTPYANSNRVSLRYLLVNIFDLRLQQTIDLHPRLSPQLFL